MGSKDMLGSPRKWLAFGCDRKQEAVNGLGAAGCTIATGSLGQVVTAAGRVRDGR